MADCNLMQNQQNQQFVVIELIESLYFIPLCFILIYQIICCDFRLILNNGCSEYQISMEAIVGPPTSIPNL